MAMLNNTILFIFISQLSSIHLTFHKEYFQNAIPGDYRVSGISRIRGPEDEFLPIFRQIYVFYRSQVVAIGIRDDEIWLTPKHRIDIANLADENHLPGVEVRDHAVTVYGECGVAVD